MPEQFPYPEKGWSTGNMRMAARPRGPTTGGREFLGIEGERRKKETKASEAGGYPELSPEEWKTWQEAPTQREPVFAPKSRPLGPFLQGMHRDGMVVEKDHPDIKNLGDDFEIFTIPDREGDLLVRPKPEPQGVV